MGLLEELYHLMRHDYRARQSSKILVRMQKDRFTNKSNAKSMKVLNWQLTNGQRLKPEERLQIICEILLHSSITSSIRSPIYLYVNITCIYIYPKRYSLANPGYIPYFSRQKHIYICIWTTNLTYREGIAYSVCISAYIWFPQMSKISSRLLHV